jgi:hypothetical protein
MIRRFVKNLSFSFLSLKEVPKAQRIIILTEIQFTGGNTKSMGKHANRIGAVFLVLILVLTVLSVYKRGNVPAAANRFQLTPRAEKTPGIPSETVHAQQQEAADVVQAGQSTGEKTANGEQNPAAGQAAPTQETVVEYTPANPAVEPVPMPAEVRGVYATGWIAGSSKYFPSLLNFIDKTAINTLVIDVKDDMGTFTYESRIPLAVQIGAGMKKVGDMVALMKTLKERNIYPIARIVVFKDPRLAEARPDLAVKNKSGGVWRDRKGLAWVDPHSREVWKYAVDVAEEAMSFGFKEIQFDYVRFTSDGKISDCVYPYADGKSKEDTIKEFLEYARERLKPYGAVISADIFGLVCSVQDDLGIGQKLEKIGAAVDILSPMVYPSHYYKGTYGLANPNLAPYETVTQSMIDAKNRLAGIDVKLRPWLQDFNLGSRYGREQIMAQIKALNDQGIRDWLFWNPSCRYDAGKYPTE